jgi:hypothetical protein
MFDLVTREFVDHAPAGGDYDSAMPTAHQLGADFDRTAFHAAGLHRRQYLYNRQAPGHGICSVVWCVDTATHRIFISLRK